MSGQGYVVGMAIATYELTAAIALIVMAKYFLPIFLEKKRFTQCLNSWSKDLINGFALFCLYFG